MCTLVKQGCIFTVIALLQLLFAAEFNLMKEWKSFTLVLRDLQWLGATTVASCSAPSSETSHHSSWATYLIKLPKQAYTFLTLNHARICAFTFALFCVDQASRYKSPKLRGNYKIDAAQPGHLTHWFWMRSTGIILQYSGKKKKDLTLSLLRATEVT